MTMINNNTRGTLESREVAEMVGKRHSDLLRDIETYIGYMEESTERKIASSDFFVESVYKDSTGRELKCYLLTKKGCEMVANKLTGAKGVQFTALYVQRFNEMEQAQASALPPASNDKQIRAQAMLLNARARNAGMILRILDDARLSSEAVELLRIEAAQMCIGKPIEYRPKLKEPKYYSATEVGQLAGGVSANTVGKVANANGLKTEEYGITVMDKSRSSNKQVATFRYNEKGKQALLSLLSASEKGA